MRLRALSVWLDLVEFRAICEFSEPNYIPKIFNPRDTTKAPILGCPLFSNDFYGRGTLAKSTSPTWAPLTERRPSVQVTKAS
jgi:hypothetical protein